jgi:hypothetical protein
LSTLPPPRLIIRFKSLFDLSGEANSASKKHNNATIVSDVR